MHHKRGKVEAHERWGAAGARHPYIDGQSREEIVTDEVIKRYGDKD